MATHSSVLAWRSPQTEEPGGLQSVGSKGVGHDWAHTRVSVCLKYFHFLVVSFLVSTNTWSSFSLETSQGNHVFSADCQPATFNLPGFPWWAQLVNNPAAIWETWVRPLGWEDPLEKGTGYPLQYCGLKNSMHCILHGLAKSRTRPSNFHTTTFRDKSTMHETVFSDFTRETNPPIKQTSGDFPGRPVVKNPPADARDMGFIPGPGITSHRATKPMHPSYWTCALKLVFHNQRNHINEKPAHRS